MLKKDPIYGTVGIVKFKNLDTGRYDYADHYIHDDEEFRFLFNGDTLIAFFREVNAVDYSNFINDLCYKASDGKISESQLLAKLNEILEK
jgi:hypothetical protein